MSHIVPTLAALLILSGCATVTFKEPALGSSFGAYPANYETLTKHAFDDVLRDPESGRYRVEQPIKGYQNDKRSGDVTWQGYLVRVEVNAKNGFGGYGGYKPYWVMIRDGRVDGIHEDLYVQANLVHLRTIEQPKSANEDSAPTAQGATTQKANPYGLR